MVFGLQDLTAAASAAKWLYENGFDHVNSAEVQYKDFGNEIKLLSRNLQLLVQCASSIEKDASSEPPRMRSQSRPHVVAKLDITTLLEICGDFKQTIDESTLLLKNNISYGRERGLSAPLTNILWNNTIKTAVVRFSNRIAIHNRKISFVLEPFKLKLLNDNKVSHQVAYRQLARGQDNNVRKIEAKLSKIATFLGAPDDEPTSAPEPLAIPPHLEFRLDDAFKKGLPELESPQDLFLKDGINAVTYHLDQFTNCSNLLVGGTRTVVIDRYLDLVKSAYVLNRIKSSREYEFKILRCRDLLWSDYLDDLEDSCRDQLRRFSDNEPEDSRLQPPAKLDFQLLYQDSFDFRFDDDQRQANDPVPGVTLGSNDEILHVPLKPPPTEVRTQEHELGLVRQSPLDLELRWFKIPKNGTSNGVTVVTPINLQKAFILPLWALSPLPPEWSIRCRGYATAQTEGSYIFVKSQDLYLFQRALLGYKVLYDNRGIDVTVRIYDSSGGPKDTRNIGKCQIWLDSKLDAPATPIVQPVASASSVSLVQPLSPTSPMSPTSRTRHLSPSSASTRRRSQQGSMSSALSGSSTANTSVSTASYTSAHTSPIRSPSGEIASVQFQPMTEPLVIFIIRSDERGHPKFFIVGVKLDAETNARTGCNSTKCKAMRRCVHATLEKPGGSRPLNVLRLSSVSVEGWNLAALGTYQQGLSPVEKPPKMHYVQVAFDTYQERDAFVKRVGEVKQIYATKRKELAFDKETARKINVIKR